MMICAIVSVCSEIVGLKSQSCLNQQSYNGNQANRQNLILLTVKSRVYFKSDFLARIDGLVALTLLK